jgi:hypothetical protein
MLFILPKESATCYFYIWANYYSMTAILEQLIKDELSRMDDRLTILEDKISSIDKNLSTVVDAICGNSLTKTGGVISDIDEVKDKIKLLEEKMQKQEDFKKKIGWTVGVVAGILVAIQYFSTIYYNVIKK